MLQLLGFGYDPSAVQVNGIGVVPDGTVEDLVVLVDVFLSVVDSVVVGGVVVLVVRVVDSVVVGCVVVLIVRVVDSVVLGDVVVLVDVFLSVVDSVVVVGVVVLVVVVLSVVFSVVVVGDVVSIVCLAVVVSIGSVVSSVVDNSIVDEGVEGGFATRKHSIMYTDYINNCIIINSYFCTVQLKPTCSFLSWGQTLN